MFPKAQIIPDRLLLPNMPEERYSCVQDNEKKTNMNMMFVYGVEENFLEDILLFTRRRTEMEF